MAQLKVGDKATFASRKYPGVWVVTKVNPTTYRLEPEGGGTALRATHSLARPAAESSLFQPPGSPAVSAFNFKLGQVVKVKPVKSKIHGLHVVTKLDGDRLTVAQLGGGSVWRVYASVVQVVSGYAVRTGDGGTVVEEAHF